MVKNIMFQEMIGSDNNDNTQTEKLIQLHPTAAKNFGGYLAVFETQAEQQNVKNLLDAVSLGGDSFWIGYKYNYETGQKNGNGLNGWTVAEGETMYTDSGNFDTSSTGRIFK